MGQSRRAQPGGAPAAAAGVGEMSVTRADRRQRATRDEQRRRATARDEQPRATSRARAAERITHGRRAHHDAS